MAVGRNLGNGQIGILTHAFAHTRISGHGHSSSVELEVLLLLLSESQQFRFELSRLPQCFDFKRIPEGSF